MSQHPIELVVNGERTQATVPARRLLVDFLRDDLNLTGTKRGCETGICGACTVLVEGRAVKSCLSLAVQAKGRRVQTVEGLAGEGWAGEGAVGQGLGVPSVNDASALHPLQESFMRCGGLQCGYCTPGFLMSACALLAKNPQPNEQEVRAGLAGNLCRCTGYSQIVHAVLEAAETLRQPKPAGAAPERIHGD
jgi:aerobic carbon-monoxide dehydrogenase small subunit